MKKIKLLTPILGLTTLTGIVAPVMTSCSGVGHVWLTSIDQQEKSGNASGITYYFGLNSELYETKDIDVQVISDNKDEFDTEWSVSGSVLKVIVKYIGEIESGSTKKTTFKLRIKTVYWADEIELKGNFVAEATMSDYIERYKEISAKWMKVAKHPTTFKITNGDYYRESGEAPIIIDESTETTNSYETKTTKKGPTAYAFVVYDGAEICSEKLTFNNPESLEQEYIELIEAGAIIKWYLPSDGSLGVDMYWKRTVDNITSISEKYLLIDKNGYFKESYKYTSRQTSGFPAETKEYRFRFSDYK